MAYPNRTNRLNTILKFLSCLQHHLKEWGSTLLPWITIVSIPVGGWWAYHNFSITDEGEWNPVISISAEVLPYDGNELLVVHVRPKNIGKVPVKLFGKNKGDISVSLAELPSGHTIGRIQDDELKVINKIESLVAENSGEYGLEPGVEYDDVQYFIVPEPKPKTTKYYVVSTELSWPNVGNPADGYVVAASTVVKVDSKI